MRKVALFFAVIPIAISVLHTSLFVNANAQETQAKFKKQCTDAYFGPFEFSKTFKDVPVAAVFEACAETISSQPRILFRTKINGALRDFEKTKRALVKVINDNSERDCNKVKTYQDVTDIRIEPQQSASAVTLAIDLTGYRCGFGLIPVYAILYVPVTIQPKNGKVGIAFGDIFVQRDKKVRSFINPGVYGFVKGDVLSGAKKFLETVDLSFPILGDFHTYKPVLSGLKHKLVKDVLVLDLQGALEMPALQSSNLVVDLADKQLGIALNKKSLLFFDASVR